MKLQTLALAVAIGCLSTVSFAQTTTETAVPFADTLTKQQAAVVSIKATGSVTMSMEGREGEQDDFEEEASAVVVSASGLVITSLTSVDPSSAYDDLPKGEEMPDVKVTSEIKSINVRFNDTKEAAYEVAVRDKDLGIAVLKPKAPLAGDVSFVDLASAGDAKALDSVLLISRLGKGANWITSARVDAVTSLFSKPRKMYHIPFSVAGEDSDIGSAVFTKDGKFLGIQVYFMMSGGEDYFLVALPAKELAAVVAQVK